MEKIHESKDSVCYRLQCDCLDPDNAKDISVEFNHLKPRMIIESHYACQSWRSWKERIYDAWKVLTGKEILVDEFVFREEDLELVGKLFIDVANDEINRLGVRPSNWK